MLKILHDVPQGLRDAPAAQIADLLGGPTLLHLPGRRRSPLFVSALLHGNEDAGLKAVQHVLRKYQTTELPRALSIFIGNVEAARLGLRRLDGQADYNRVWPGGPRQGHPEEALMAQVVEEMRQRHVFASIDVHNNTGINPHYACVNLLDHRFLHLATLFSRIVVYFTEPAGVQSLAFAPLCPAVTLESGKAGSPGSDTHAAEFIDAVLHLSEFPQHPIAHHDIDLYHTVATVKIPDYVSFSFDHSHADVRFVPDIDRLNFRELKAGTPIAQVVPDCRTPLYVPDAHGHNRWRDFFAREGEALSLRRTLMPSMLTLDQRVIQQDCLCYLMERLPVPAA
jgi:succinylglutamate desuccinylase